MSSHTVTMSLVRETKGALRYEGIDGDNPVAPHYLIGTLYLRKAGLEHWIIEDGEGWPNKITVEVTT